MRKQAAVGALWSGAVSPSIREDIVRKAKCSPRKLGCSKYRLGLNLASAIWDWYVVQNTWFKPNLGLPQVEITLKKRLN